MIDRFGVGGHTQEVWVLEIFDEGETNDDSCAGPVLCELVDNRMIISGY